MSSSSFIMFHTKRTWGAGHISTLDMVNNIGLLYGNQGKWRRQRRCTCGRCKGKEKAWGAEHTSTLETVSPSFASSQAPELLQQAFPHQQLQHNEKV